MRIDSEKPVALLGASPVSHEILAEVLAFAPDLVAADGGAALAIEAGVMPRAVIGDFDSLSDEVRRAVPADRLFHVAEQDTTDFEKCLTRINAPVILALGFTGRRLDHELAVYNAIVRHPARSCVVVGDYDLALHVPERLELDLPAGTRLSLFPMAEIAGRATGLRWPIEGLAFSPSGRVGTSNAATGPVMLSFDRPGMLAILPRSMLRQVLRALRVPGSAASPGQ